MRTISKTVCSDLCENPIPPWKLQKSGKSLESKCLKATDGSSPVIKSQSIQGNYGQTHFSVTFWQSHFSHCVRVPLRFKFLTASGLARGVLYFSHCLRVQHSAAIEV